VCSSDLLDEADKGKIYDFFMNYGKTNDAKELDILKELQWAPFKASSDDQLLPIRQLALFKNRAKMINNSGMSDADKAEKIKEIDEQLAMLNRRMAALQAAAL